MRRWLAGFFLVATSACGAVGTPAPTTPATPPKAPIPAAEPAKTQAPPQAPKPDPLAAVPAVPPNCQVYVGHPAGSSCQGGKPGLLAAIDAALAQTDTEQRDARLAAVEGCTDLPGGLVRALRAEFAPVACSDALVEPVLAAGTPESLRRDLKEALEGLRLAGKLSRLVTDPPKLAEPFDKPAFDRFEKERIEPWIVAQATAVGALSLEATHLQGYGKGVAAVEAGLADMRFVEAVRAVPLPKEMADDAQVRDQYYGSLDQALEPRKDRGRDAALAGLGLFAREGILNDARVVRARMLLSKAYGGRRIDALDGLLLPPAPAFEGKTLEERLISKLPTFYVGYVLDSAAASKPELLRAMLERGIPQATDRALTAAKLSPEARSMYARVRLGLGQRYWRSEDFSRAADLVRDGASSEEARLLSALALALKGGPRDAAQMMLGGSLVPSGEGNVTDLDTLAKRAKGAVAGYAAYDAAYVLQLALPPADAGRAYWEGIAKRFEQAAKQLPQAAQKAEAAQRAKAARDTAAAIR